MPVTIPSGLGATLGCVLEGSYGGEPAVTRWYLWDASDGFEFVPNIVQSEALNTTSIRSGSRRMQPTTEGKGSFKLDLTQSGHFGRFFAVAFGNTSAPVELGTTGAYLQQYTYATNAVGYSLNFQKGIPETPSGTIVPFSYPGSKITDLEISCKVNEIVKMMVTLDCQQEDPVAAYAAPTIPTGLVPYTFAGSNAVLLGGTATQPATVVAAGSDGGEISNVASWSAPSAGVLDATTPATNGFSANGGLLTVATSSTPALVAYTGVTASAFTGCTYVSGSATGTVATGGAIVAANGAMVVSGAAAPTGIVSGFSIKFAKKLNTKRFNIGSATKSEPIENGFGDITGSLDMEFATKADFYTTLIANNNTPLQIQLIGSTEIASGPYFPYIHFVIPQVFFDAGASPKAESDDVIKVTVPFTGLYNDVNPPAQVDIQSVDVTA